MSTRKIAVNPSAVPASLLVDADGYLKVVLAGGGGGGGDATAANQLLQLTQLETIADYTTATVVEINNTNGFIVDFMARFPGTQLSATNPWPVQPVGGAVALFPTAAAPANNVTTPSVTKIQAILSGVEPNSGNLYRVDVDTARRLATVANVPMPSTTSQSTSYVVQRTAAAFACTVRSIEAFSTSAGYVVLIDKASAAADGDFPKGASVYPIAANGRIEHEWQRGLSFSSGCVIALCTAVSPTITLAGTSDAIFRVQLD